MEFRGRLTIVNDSTDMSQDPRVDPASLGLATIAGTWALFGPPGDWTITSVVIGLSITFLLLGYHGGAGTNDDTPPAWFRRAAFAALLALSICLTLAYPLQVLVIQPLDPSLTPETPGNAAYHVAADRSTTWLFR